MRKIQLQTSICWHRRAKLKRFSEGGKLLNVTKMNGNESFSMEEMSQLEVLDIKGGKYDADVIQNQCPNNVAGCACNIENPIKNL